jgi:hypothetical protein
MATADHSYSARLARLRERTQAIFRVRNPTLREFGTSGNATPESVRLSRSLGQITITLEGPDGNLTTIPPCCPSTCNPVCPVSTIPIFDQFANTPSIIPGDLSGDDSGIPVAGIEDVLSELYGRPITITPPEGYTNDQFLFLVFPPYCNSTNITVTLVINDVPVTFQSIQYGPTDNPDFIYGDQGLGGAFVIFPNFNLAEAFSVSVTLTASNSCSSSSGEAALFCFLAGSPVTMEDGTTKSIETVAVGDRVVGAFGEINTVEALQVNPLGLATISNINGEHKTTSHHPHISTDRKFCCVKPMGLSLLTYGKQHWVVGANGIKKQRIMKGVRPDRITTLDVGMTLQTLTGPRTVTTIEHVSMPSTTPVYHLAVSGSHTYIVDGYAVSGWPNEDDFDYDTWMPRT